MSHLIDFHLLNDMKNIITKVENLHLNNRNNQHFHVINHIKIHTSTYSGNQYGCYQIKRTSICQTLNNNENYDQNCDQDSSQNNYYNCNYDHDNHNQDQKSKNLIERGPIKSQFSSLNRNKPYCKNLEHSQHLKTNEIFLSDYDKIDKEDCKDTWFNLLQDFETNKNSNQNTSQLYNLKKDFPTPIENVSSNDLEISLLEMVKNGAFQEGQHVTESCFAHSQEMTMKNYDSLLNNDNIISSDSKNELNHTHLSILAVHMHSPKWTQQNLNYNLIDSSQMIDTTCIPMQISYSLNCSPSSLNQSYNNTSNSNNSYRMISGSQIEEQFEQDLTNESLLDNIDQLIEKVQDDLNLPKVDETENLITNLKNNFQISKTISFKNQYFQQLYDSKEDKQFRLSRLLRLPSVKASEKLKEKLNPDDVEKAMINLLKKSAKTLTKQDEDGYTKLMCLVSHPNELLENLAYLVPLVERLSIIDGALTIMNNRGEDALYLAALNCPQFSFVVGYLAATMLEKGININQKLYDTQDNTLIHSITARGDFYKEVLNELLTLKTIEGNMLFDLSKRNCDGKTALHIAIESHKPFTKGITSLETVKLLLKYGANPKIKETKYGNNALHMAIFSDCDPILIKLLLDTDASDLINAVNNNHDTALHLATAMRSNIFSKKQEKVCWLLFNAGSDPNLPNHQGKTPLAFACLDGKEAIRRIFYKT
ncbi:homeobox protein 2-like [Apis mellifera caucasica]|nr:homeobox protein 2-like [Apis mellifera caucasica]